jgi:DNA-binding ferritin-like protein (Dps family)
MHNWWIAALEHAGIWTREQAEHVSNNIKLTTHRENYKEAYGELLDILEKGKFETQSVVQQLGSDVAHLKSVAETKPIAKPKKV